MTSNGGTMPVPQSQSASSFSCSICGLMFESGSSLQVHMHYQHREVASNWGTSPSSTTPSSEGPETNNNHQPLGKHHIKAVSPHQNTIAPADSSDNNPPTPQPNEPGTPQSFHSGTQSPYSSSQHPPSAAPSSNEQREMAASYPSYQFDQYYHGVDYGHAQAAHHHLLNNGQHHQQEYKTVPSSRYHQQTPPFNSASHNTQTTSSNSVQITNGLSPRMVSSSSPTTQTSTSPASQLMHIPPPGQPTPSPSPKQCDKCGVVCETDGQLIEHSQIAHAGILDNGSNGVKSENGDQQQNYPPFPPAPHHYNQHGIKEEPSSDILDLDSQKMVYPPHPDGSLPPMHSLHPLQSMQRHPMMWGHDAHFIPPHPSYQGIKPEYPPTPPIKNEYMHVSHMKSAGEYSPILPPTPASMKQEYNHIKADFNGPTGMAQSGSLPPTSSISSKNFVTDISDGGNQLTTSPSDFPSTTTPHQENGSQYQRSFEPPTSSLPSSKGANWKSNEARRPKTYNCTACNKWFTSSGHLKRHYNTTLHKNAVKSSGQPDPATLPISAHHHPNRDPNYMGKRRSHHNRNQQANQQQQQQQAATVAAQSASQNQLQQQTSVSESSTRSPDYQPQYPPLPSFGSAALQQGFGQYGSNNLHNSPGNGQAGPSVHVASQPRGLHQILMSNSNLSIQTDHQALHQHQPEQLLHQPHHQLGHISTIITNSTLPQCTTMQSLPINSINNLTDPQYPLHISTNTHSYHITIMEQQSYLNTIGNLRQSSSSDSLMEEELSPQMQNNEQQLQYSTLPSIHPYPGLHMTTYDQARYGGGTAYAADMVPPFSPDIPDQYQRANETDMPQFEHETLPQGASMITPPQSSPSLSPTDELKTPEERDEAAALAEAIERKKEALALMPFSCAECSKNFHKSCYLTQHNKTFHIGEKNHKCVRCGKRFETEKVLEEHVAKHGGDKPFKCQECPKAFNHKTDLRRHMCLHSGSKPYACKQCGKGFIRKDHMVKHLDTHMKKLNSNKRPKASKKTPARLNLMTLQMEPNDSALFGITSQIDAMVVKLE